jgi:hypothetical protein
MEKKFTKIEVSIIKSQAQNIAKFEAKKNNLDSKIAKIKEAFEAKLQQKIASIEAEKEATESLINSMEEPIMKLTGGYKTSDLVNCEVIHTGKINTNTGKEIVKNHYVLKYPETVIPVSESDTEESIADVDTTEEQCTTTNSDFDSTTAEEEVKVKSEEELDEEFGAENVEDSADTELDNNTFGDWE